MAQAGSRVVVVDADMRRPASHVHLKGALQPGLTDVLKERLD
jgi:Mrp family chromosome partitioning ATPase